MDVSKVVSQSGAIVEQARADNTVGHAPVPEHGDVVSLDAAIHLDLDRSTPIGYLCVDRFRKPTNLGFHVRDEGLASKSGIDAHDEDKINFAQHLKCGFDWSARVQNNACRCSALADGCHETMEMFYSLNMDGDVVATCIDVVLIAVFGVFNHQVRVKCGIGSKRSPQTPDHWRTEGQIGHKVAIHDIEMEPIQASVKRLLAIG